MATTHETRRPLTKRDKALARARALAEIIARKPGTETGNDGQTVNQAEVANAWRALRHMKALYGITEAELEEGADGRVQRREGIGRWEFEVPNTHSTAPMRRDAFSWIGQAYGARCLARRMCTPSKKTKGARLEFFAPDSVVETLRIVIPALMDYAENQVAAGLAEKRAELRQDPTLSKRDRRRKAHQWAKGWWIAFGEATAHKVESVRLHTIDESLGAKKGELVRQSDMDRVDAYIKQLYPKLRSASKSRIRFPDDALRAGAKAGREALVGQGEVSRQGR